MTRPDTDSFRRYLEAKRTVDDRALDRRVMSRLRDGLAAGSGPLTVVEVGAGIGTTIERVLDWDELPRRVRYTAIELDPDLVDHLRVRLSERFAVTTRGDAMVIDVGDRKVILELVCGDALEVIGESERTWDLLVAQSFLDLVDLDAAVTTFVEATTPGGLVYCPLTFDGGTVFHPPIDLDDRVERHYHRHMDTGDAGTSRAGRRLLARLPAVDAEIVAAGSSDWVVVPAGDGYPADEAYFLHYIIDTVEGALAADPALDAEGVAAWTEIRHRQIEAAELRYIAHQLDVLGRAPGP